MNELRSPEQIEREISEIRAQIDHTLDAVQEKLSPGELLDQALTYVKDETGIFAGNFGRAVQNNPIPSALLGISLAWLAFAARSGPPAGARSYGYREGRPGDGSYGYETRSGWGEAAAERWHDTTERVGETAEDLRDRSRDAYDAASTRTSELAGRAADMKDRAMTRVSDAADEATHRWHNLQMKARYAGARVQEGWDSTRRRVAVGGGSAVDVLKGNPLATVALGLAAGAIVAALLPRTQREDELMGEHRDELVRTVKDTAASVAAPAVEATEQAVEETVERATDTMHDVEDEAKPESERDFGITPQDSPPLGSRPVAT